MASSISRQRIVLYDLQNKLCQVQFEYDQHVAEQESIKRLQSAEFKLPTDAIGGTYDDLFLQQKDFQSRIRALEELIAQDTTRSREEIAIAERELEAILKKTSEQLNTVVEKQLLLQHMQQMQIEFIDPAMLSESRARLELVENDVCRVQKLIDDENERATKELVMLHRLSHGPHISIG